jgi:hypothetical protein
MVRAPLSGGAVSKRALADVMKAFTNEAEVAFGFLASDFGLSGPDRQALVMPGVAYVGSGLRYRISLDADDGTVVAQVERDVDGGRLVANLPKLVFAAGFGPANRVSRNASTLHHLRRSLADQARYVRRLHPILASMTDDSGWAGPAEPWPQHAKVLTLPSVEPLLPLPDLPQNASLLEFLRYQSRPPSGPGDYTLGSWQLHTHPDLMERLRELAPGWPLTAAYGVPMLARDGIAVLVALGTDWLALRIGQLPPWVQTKDPAPAWTFAGGDWHIISPWRTGLGAEGDRKLRELVAAALADAASLG